MTSGRYCFMYPTLDEIREPEEAKISGSLPDWVQGTLIRTGPGKFDFNDDFTVNHFLDGYAMLTRFQITQNSVKYDRRFLETDAYKKAITAQRPVISEFGTKGQKADPTKSILTRFIPSLIPEISDNCNVSMFRIGNDVFAAADTCMFRQVNPMTLECGEKYDTSKLFGLNLWSCHPVQDKDGYIYNIGTSFITGLKYNIIKIPVPAEGQSSKDVLKKAKILATISSRSTFCVSPCHSFGKTTKYIIFIEQPLVIVGQKVLTAFLHKACNRDFMEYRPEMKNRFHVIEKETGKVIKTEFISAEAFFFLHIVNCYEEGNEIVVDIVAFPNANCINLNLEDFRNGNEGPLEDLAEGRRYVIPLVDLDQKGKEVPEGVNLIKRTKTTAKARRERKCVILTYEALTKPGIEVPIVHKAYWGKKYKMFFGGGPRTVGPYKTSICKFNTETKESFVFRLSDEEFLGEPIFIPNPDSLMDAEDDGILVTCLTRAVEGQKCGLVFIDAKTMCEIARAEFKNFVPLAIHGIFLPISSLKTIR